MLFFFCDVVAITVGSDTAVSREAFTVFPAADTDNEILGFAAFDDGFAFEDNTTSCTFNALFPVQEVVALSGGALLLEKNLTLEGDVSVGVGCINADSRTVYLPNPEGTNILPNSCYDTYISLVDQVNTGTVPITTLDWSFDSQYIAVGTAAQTGGPEIQIYHRLDNVITLTASIEAGNFINTLRWSPREYYLAGGSAIDPFELATFFLNVAAGTFTVADTFDAPTAVTAISWDPGGDYIIVGLESLTLLGFFSVSAGTISLVTTLGFGSTRTVSNDALDWRSTGTYFVVGVDVNAAPELAVGSFDGTTAAFLAAAELGETIISLDWKPSSSLIAVGLGGTTTRLRVFNHDLGTSLTEVAANTESITINGVDWAPNGKKLATAKSVDGSGQEFEVLNYDENAMNFAFFGADEQGVNVNTVRWSPSGEFLVTGNNDGDIYLYRVFDPGLTIKNGNVVLRSDMQLTKPIILDGNCTLHGGGYTIDFAGTGSLVVTSGSSLEINDVTFVNVTNNRLVNLDTTSTVTLRNVTMIVEGDVTFDTGVLAVTGDTIISGTQVFIYTSEQQSSIHENATLCFDQGMTFSYAPTIADNSLLQLASSNAVLALKGASLHATTTGLHFQNGILDIDGTCVVTSDATVQAEGIMFGDGASAVNDTKIKIGPESILDVERGIVVYNNVNC